MITNKIFGLGLSHTGTTSLNQALNILGIKSYHCPLDDTTRDEIAQGQYKLSVMEKYQAITDIIPVPIYQQLDQAFPNSKFILTTRDRDAWMKSMTRVNENWKLYYKKNLWQKFWLHFGEHRPAMGRKIATQKAWFRVRHDKAIEQMRRRAYGDIAFENVEHLGSVFDRHYKEVREYFKDRPKDLLEIDITKGEGWDKLCRFLGVETPNEPFPHKITQKFHPTKNIAEYN